jgi:hypothetical protein
MRWPLKHRQSRLAAKLSQSQSDRNSINELLACIHNKLQTTIRHRWTAVHINEDRVIAAIAVLCNTTFHL